jgi:hypothetical protein
MIKLIIGDKSAAGELKIECFNKYLTGVSTGSINVNNIFFILPLIRNHEVNIYRNKIISSTTKKT